MHRGLSTIVAVLTFSHIFVFHPVQLNSIQSLINFSFLICTLSGNRSTNHKSANVVKDLGSWPKGSSFRPQKGYLNDCSHKNENSVPHLCVVPTLYYFLCSVEHKQTYSTEFPSCFFPYSENCGHFHCMEKSCLSIQLNSCFCGPWKKFSHKAYGQLSL